MRPIRRLSAAAGCCTAAFVLNGCAGQGSAEDHNAEAVVTQFVGSIRTDPAAACALLAPATLTALQDHDGDCPTGLPQQIQPPSDLATSTAVYGKYAIVHVGADTIFAARFDDGWRVTAAGCTPQADRPYNCKIKGN